MKKSCGALVVLLVLLLATGARAVEFTPLLGLTVKKAFNAMQAASSAMPSRPDPSITFFNKSQIKL